MKELKYIDQLFKTAKEEKPQRSFDDVAKRFENSLTIGATLSSPQTLLSKLFSLNSLLILTFVTSISLVLFLITNTNTEVINDTDTISSKISQEVINNKKTEDAPVDVLSQKKLDGTVLTQIDIPIIETAKENANSPMSVINEKKPTSINKVELPKAKEQTLDTNKAKSNEIESKQSSPRTDRKFSTTAIELIKPSNQVTEPTIIETKTANDKLESIGSIDNKEQTFSLFKSDNQEDAKLFLESIQAFGIQTNLQINKREKGVINKLTLQLNHPQGLDWRIKLDGFEQLEIKLLLSDQKQPFGVTYRLNLNGDFAEYLTLKHLGRSFHKFAQKGIRSKHQHTKRLTVTRN